LAQATEERPKVLASITGEESRYVLEEDGGRSVALHKVKEGIGEAGSGAVVLCSHASSLAGDGEVLAGEAAGPEGGVWNAMTWLNPPSKLRGSVGLRSLSIPLYRSKARQFGDVSEVRDSGPSLGEDGTGAGVDLGEADGAPSGSLKPKVKSSDS
jgi:hypothetical protein